MRGRRVLALVLLLVGVGACGGDGTVPEDDLALRIVIGRAQVATGASFPLTVTRTWSKELVPAPWDDGMLAPFVVRLEGTTRRESTTHVQETFVYRAYAFALGDVTLPSRPFVARPLAGGALRAVRSTPLRLRVVPVLDAAAPGPPELPGAPLAEPSPLPSLSLVAVLLVAGLGAGLLLRRRGTKAAGTPPAVAGTPSERALDALRRIGLREGDDGRDVAEAAEVVRGYAEEALHVAATCRTREETLASAAFEAGEAARLDEVLAPADAVKFARHVPTPAERGRVLAQASAFVRATGSDGR